MQSCQSWRSLRRVRGVAATSGTCRIDARASVSECEGGRIQGERSPEKL